MKFYDKHKGWIDQLLHVVVFGAIATLHPALAIFAVLAYELADWHWEVGPITIGQWPPGDPYTITRFDVEVGHDEQVTQMDRVNDLRLDLIFEFLGVLIGGGLHAWIF